MNQENEQPAIELDLKHQKNYKSFFESFESIQNGRYSISIANLRPISSDNVFKALFEKPKPNLTKVHLHSLDLNFQSLKLFCSQKWPCLSSLKMIVCPIGSQGAEQLSKCSLPFLKQLDLGYCSLSETGVESISKGEWPYLSQVSIYDLQLSLKSFAYLINSKWTNLEMLNLRSDEVTNKYCRVIDSKPLNCKKLKKLILSHPSLTEDSIKEIVSNQLSELSQLLLYGCPISGKMIFNPKFNEAWLKLRTISFGSSLIHNNQTLLGLASICQNNLSKLHKLIINDCSISKEAARNLTKASWPELKLFSLNNCTIDEIAIGLIGKCRWVKLLQININSESICQNLANSLSLCHWPKIRGVGLRYLTTVLGYLNLSKIHEFGHKQANYAGMLGVSKPNTTKEQTQQKNTKYDVFE